MGILIKETGATSLYETWDVTRRIGDASLNHPSMGAVSAWMYKYPAGIRLSPDASAFKKILIQPCFLSDLDFVEASHESIYGTIRVDWRREEGKIRLHLVLPSTAMGTVVLPGQKPKAVKGANTFCHSRIVICLYRMKMRQNSYSPQIILIYTDN